MSETSAKKIYVGAIILGVGTFIAKLLGAAYRIPLTKIVGASGLGLYQMVFPVYTLLLDLSGASVPSAISKLVSSYGDEFKGIYAKKTLRVSLLFFSVLGLILSLFTALFANAVAFAQGDIRAGKAYLLLSPSVFIVCVISCFRGYFQGFMNMVPTAVSQITEQVIKLVFGLLLADYFMPDVARAVAGATLAITVSEIFAFIQLFIFYKLRKKGNVALTERLTRRDFSSGLKDVLSYAFPIAVSGLILPLSKVLDSFLVINILKAYSDNATGLYGLYSGVAVTVIGLPVAVCYGIAAVAVPAVSGAKGKGVKRNSLNTLVLTFSVSFFCAAACFIFAPHIVEILFGYLSPAEKEISVKLLKLSSPCVTLLSVLQTANAVLIGRSAPFKPIIGMTVGVTVKTVVEILALKNPNINVFGVAIGSIACYFVADLINLSMIPLIKGRRSNESRRVKDRRYAGT
ncbi:MAG: polysaccharide biosynthesis protein [Clostridia bacterium]|nr:polysaccharide biosynthesis protein [Clostridia bacterium]